MRKSIWISLLAASALISLLAVSVDAQEGAAAAATPSAVAITIEPITATIRQQVPLSLTLRVPLGPTDTQTLTVPLLFHVNLQIALSDRVTPTVELTATVNTSVTATNAPTATVAAAAPLPTAPPTPLPPTPTALPTAATLTTTAPLMTTGALTATPVSTTTVVAPDCADPRARIRSPGIGQVISGTMPIIGSAAHEDFQYYKLEYTPGAEGGPSAQYYYFGGGDQQVENGELALFATQALANGPYVLRLTVVDNTGNFPPPCTVPVEVAN